MFFLLIWGKFHVFQLKALNMHTNIGLAAIFFLFFLSYIPVDEKYCIFPPVGGIASVFSSCNREFHLVFKYVYVYICLP